jgi:hypothetical protein
LTLLFRTSFPFPPFHCYRIKRRILYR